jgi:hypothetical protein
MAPDLYGAYAMMKGTFLNIHISQLMSKEFLELGMARRDFIIVAAGCLIIFIVSLLKERGVHIREAVAAKPLPVRWALYYGFILLIIFFGYTGTSTGFLYANF